MFLDFLGKQAGSLLSCFSRHDYKCLEAAFKMYEQQKMMFEQNVRSCADRISAPLSELFVLFSQKQAWRPSKREFSAPSTTSWEFYPRHKSAGAR